MEKQAIEIDRILETLSEDFPKSKDFALKMMDSRLIFLGENDFGSSLQHFLNNRVRKINS